MEQLEPDHAVAPGRPHVQHPNPAPLLSLRRGRGRVGASEPRDTRHPLAPLTPLRRIRMATTAPRPRPYGQAVPEELGTDERDSG
jgi:hypothetical protein